MRTPSTAVRGVFVTIIILGVVFISNIGIVQSGAKAITGNGNHVPGQVLQDVPTPSPTPEAKIPAYFPLARNNYGYLYNSVITANGQGFDHCKPLTVGGMQNWWDNSPYSTLNIYLGGISALCPFDQLGTSWYSQIAAQGWSFILTWAGPQAPQGCPEDCKFRYPMSTDSEIAYLEGKLEALYASEAALNLGFRDRLVIYYDVESYSGADEETRATVAAFIRGWTEQLHTLGHLAGAYGAACTSYVIDWAFNDPPLDDIWIAQWNKEWAYDPGATVYNTTCLDEKGQPPIFWTNHQRLKQYTGPHNENWGNLIVKIDSNVLDGQVNILSDQPPEPTSLPTTAAYRSPQVTLTTSPHLRELQLLSATTGWVLREHNLLWTADGGHTWQDISPRVTSRDEILGVQFINQVQGWLVSRQLNETGNIKLSIFRTLDAGNKWTEIPLVGFSQSEILELETAKFQFLDDATGWLAFKLISSSNFSFGRLLATKDGGLTWQERDLPLGEPVVFQDELHGWTVGGPLNQAFYTDDGGVSWTLSEDQTADQVANLLTAEQMLLEGKLPQNLIALDSIEGQIGWALVQEGTCSGFKPRAGESVPTSLPALQCESNSRLLKTVDGGHGWSEITPAD